MRVSAELDDVTITLGNNGITFKIADNAGVHQGSLRIGQATVEWMKGRTRKGNGVKIPLSKLVELIETAG
jgi:hypothetical protein